MPICRLLITAKTQTERWMGAWFIDRSIDRSNWSIDRLIDWSSNQSISCPNRSWIKSIGLFVSKMSQRWANGNRKSFNKLKGSYEGPLDSISSWGRAHTCISCKPSHSRVMFYFAMVLYHGSLWIPVIYKYSWYSGLLDRSIVYMFAQLPVKGFWIISIRQNRLILNHSNTQQCANSAHYSYSWHALYIPI